MWRVMGGSSHRPATDLTGGIGGGGAAPQYSPHSTAPVPQIFWRLGEGGRILAVKRPKFGAEGVVLEKI